MTQPRTIKTFDDLTLKRLIKTYGDISYAKRQRAVHRGFCYDLPHEVGLQLTYKCNLRCKHCFQWDKNGFFQGYSSDKQQSELAFSIIEKILQDSYTEQGNLYIWGGEPLIHSQWHDIADLLSKDNRWKVLSTNGLLIGENIESILKISENLVLIISIDGFEEGFDAIRGKGIYQKLISNLQLLYELKRKNIYKGLITINYVLSDENISTMAEFLECYNDSALYDTVYFTFPYYISDETAETMNRYFAENFTWLNKFALDHKPSWFSYNHHISDTRSLKQQLQKLQTKDWRVRVRLQPPLGVDDVDEFILGKAKPAQNRTECYATTMRMDILADGSVLTCKLFPELTIGSVYQEDIKTIWNNSNYREYRKIIGGGLMPICSQCIFLYLYGR